MDSERVEEVWARWVRGSSKVQARVKNWTITFIRQRRHVAEEGHPYTRIEAPYVSKDRFEFMMHPMGTLNKLTKLFGAQHVQVEDPYIDRHFIIKANDEAKCRALFANPSIRQLISVQPEFGQFGTGSNVLYFDMTGHIMDVKEFRFLFELFTETLHQLVAIGSASEEAPNVEV